VEVVPNVFLFQIRIDPGEQRWHEGMLPVVSRGFGFGTGSFTLNPPSAIVTTLCRFVYHIAKMIRAYFRKKPGEGQFMRLLRLWMNLWFLMVGIAIAGGILAIIVAIRNEQLNRRYKAASVRYQRFAEAHAESEANFRRWGREWMDAVDKAQAKAKALDEWYANRTRNPDTPIPVLNIDESGKLSNGKKVIAWMSECANYSGRMKQKYQLAALRPWEPLSPDPAPPPNRSPD
jgi:hypothetical protein